MQHVATRTRTPESRVPTRLCDKPGCKQHTRERKPFCSEHIMEIDRPRRLFAILEKAEKEIERVGKQGPRAVSLDGLVVEEILAGLVHAGSITWRALCKNHVNFFNQVENDTVDHYLMRLQREELVDVRRNKRGCDVVSLTTKGLRLAQGEI